MANSVIEEMATTPAAVHDDSTSKGDAQDASASTSNASTDASPAEASERLVVPDDVIASLQADSSGNIDDINNAEVTVDPDDVRFDDERADAALMSFLKHILTSRVADADDVVDDAALPGYDGVRSSDANLPIPANATAPTGSMQTFPVDLPSSVIELDQVPTLVRPTEDKRQSDDASTKLDAEGLKAPSWQGVYSDQTQTRLGLFDGDGALAHLFESIFSNSSGISDTNNSFSVKTHKEMHRDLLRTNMNQKKSTSDSTGNITSDALSASKKADNGSQLMQPLESTLKESLATFSHQDNENASRFEPASHGKQITVENSSRNKNAWSSVAAMKPKPKLVSGNGNSTCSSCLGTLVCNIRTVWSAFFYLRASYVASRYCFLWRLCLCAFVCPYKIPKSTNQNVM